MWGVIFSVVVFAGGFFCGILFLAIFAATEAPAPTRFSYYTEGYRDGNRDAAAGIWRGGPLQ